jgi:hypothetical protein
VATYAAGRTAAFVAPSRLRNQLAPVALGGGKVTSRKEALRLLARFSTPGFGEVLRSAWDVPGQHRDVRAAVVSAARQRLDDPSSWEILTSASQNGDRYDVRAVVRADPFSVAAADRPRYASLVALACTHADREAARSAWGSLPHWTQWILDLSELLVGQLSDLDDLSLWPSATNALVSLLGHGHGAAELSSAVEALMRLDASSSDEDDLGQDPEQDRPAYRRLVRLVENMVSWSQAASSQDDRGSLVVVGRKIAAYPDRQHLAARLLTHAIRLDDTATIVVAVSEICELLADAAVASICELSTELTMLVEDRRPAEAGRLFDAAQHFAARTDLAAGMMALGLAGYGDELGWPDEWRQLVLGLRRHRSPDVRLAALNLSLAPA